MGKYDRRKYDNCQKTIPEGKYGFSAHFTCEQISNN